MRILALDLGTKTGWAYGNETCVPVGSGTCVLGTSAELSRNSKAGNKRNSDPRFMALWNLLYLRNNDQRLDAIYFEDVEFGSALYQVQLWSGLRAVVMLYGQFHNIKTVGVPIWTIKKFAGGGASKQSMERSLKSLGLWLQGMDDNEVDAVHLLRYAFANE